MSYNPSIDLLALLRETSGGMRVERMPGLDYLVVGLARAGMFLLSTDQTPPTDDRAITVWLRPAQPSWATEGAVYLYNAATLEYEPATPALWGALFIAVSFLPNFQSVVTGAAAVGSLTSMLAIQRVNPAATALALPSVLTRTRPLQLVDWSTAVVDHQITLTAFAGETVMLLPSFVLLSNAVQLAGVTLYPASQLNGWAIAP